MSDFLSTRIVGANEVWRWFVFCGAVLVGMAAGRVARFFMERTAKDAVGGRREWLAVLLRSLSRAVILLALVIGLHLGLLSLVLSEDLQDLAATVLAMLDAAAVGFAIYCLVDILDYYLKRLASRTESRVDDILAPLAGKSVRITVGALVLVNIIHAVSGKSITTILAGLGVGGLAVALAAQDTIKNFFGSLVIMGDKPFEIGDRIVVSGHDGPVENVGFRSTKIRTLEGHLVTVPNSEIVNTTIQNIGKRPYIRHLANITITYDTPPEKVERAVAIVREILDGHEGIRPDLPPRVYFNAFNDWSLNLIVIYWYHPPDYWSYLAFAERVNMEILKRFNREGIEFAFPTQTVHLAGEGA